MFDHATSAAPTLEPTFDVEPDAPVSIRRQLEAIPDAVFIPGPPDCAIEPDTAASLLDELEGLTPGQMANHIATIDPGRLEGHDQLILLQAQARTASFYTARMYATMTAIVATLTPDNPGPDDHQLAAEAAATEIAAALHLTRRAADAELFDARELNRRLPTVAEAFETGSIDLRRVRTILRGTQHLSTGRAQAVAERILDEAPRLTTGQIAARIRRLCIEADPDDAQRRYEDAVADRRIVMESTPHGTATLLGLELPPDRLAAGMDRVNALAQALRTAGETRTIDQLRADVVLDLLEGTGPAATSRRGTVDIRADLATLAGLADHPGELSGYGPIIADVVRQTALRQVDGDWQVTVTDPDTSDVITVVPTRRRPTRAQQRLVRATFPSCTWPGCRMPARATDLDHTAPWVTGGPTVTTNLAPLCRHHHRVRHTHGWSYRRTTSGEHRFTSPLGHTYTTRARDP